MKIFIQDSAGNRYECEVSPNVQIGRIAADFSEDMGWAKEDAQGRKQRLVVELVIAGKKSQRLKSDDILEDAHIQEGATLRVFPEVIPEINDKFQLNPVLAGEISKTLVKLKGETQNAASSAPLKEVSAKTLKILTLGVDNGSLWSCEPPKHISIKNLIEKFIKSAQGGLNTYNVISQKKKILLNIGYTLEAAGIENDDTLIVGETETILSLLPYSRWLDVVPTEIFLRGLEQLLGYLQMLSNPAKFDLVQNSNLTLTREVGPNEIHSMNECKLVFIGEGNVGKTSLIRYLVEERYNKKEPRTETIAIREWLMPIDAHTVINLNVWDFGGQEIYHSIHRMFISPRSIYVVVANPRNDGTYGIERELYHWLEILNNLAPNSPIIVAIHKCELYDCNLGEGSFKDRFPQIVGFVKTSCDKPQGREGLISFIAIAKWFCKKRKKTGKKTDFGDNVSGKI